MSGSTPGDEGGGEGLFSPTMLLGQEEEQSPALSPDAGDHLLPSTGAQDPQRHDDDDEPPLPLCSVLNLVVDFCMMPPTVLFEPEEYHQNDVQVPVLRFFGPIARRLQHICGSTTGGIELLPTNVAPQQSACLFVHGAFPYMVARPVAAGPDGSGTGGGCVWDSVSTVERMVVALTDALEAALLETNASFESKSTTGSSSAVKPPAALRRRIIRRITVVTGRGFYTYCPGPAAPFLRVEYYCPDDRWKVKRCLERGLADLPAAMYHPMLLQQQHVGEDGDLLRFNCYEAHIPYTMQFFKDWNLAGMSYIHVASTGADVKFRHPLPSSVRQKWLHRANDDATAESDVTMSSRAVFLASNTPKEYLWSGSDKSTDTTETSYNIGVPNENETNELDGNVDGGTEPQADPGDSRCGVYAARRDLILKKLTSCDLELDISVSSILNVFDVMTDLPEEWEARQQIHWRAVPSLREIWSQERRRMAKLLQPKDDFLSGVERSEPPPFTLNVKRDASLPGAKLAGEGMRRLVQVTGGLEESFRRAMKEIVERHAKNVDRSDFLLRRRDTVSRVKNCSATGKKRVDVTKDEYAEAGGESLTPSYDEAMEALGALGGLFEKSFSPESNVGRASSRHLEDGYGQLEASHDERHCGQALSQDSVPSSSQLPQSCSEKLALRLSQACSSSSLELSKDSLLDEYVLSQRVERGDGIVDSHFESIDDVIDPCTLAPYEAFDDEDDDDGFLGDDDEGEDFDERKMEQLLSTLATQVYMSNTKKQPGDSSSFDDDADSVDSSTLLTGRSVRDIDVIFGSDDDASFVETPFVRGPTASLFNVDRAFAELGSDEPKRLESFDDWQHAPDVSIECRESPPTREEVIELTDATFLHPMQSPGNVSPWTTFMAEYDAFRGSIRNENWFPAVGRDGVDVLQVCSPPTRKDVVTWYKKRSKRQQSPGTNGSTNPKRRRTSTEESKADLCLLADENSRKLVVEAVPDAMHEAVDIEEVVWELSQESIPSTTQLIDIVKLDTEIPKASGEASQSTRESHEQVQIRSSGPMHTFSTPFEAQSPDQALRGLGNQGGRLLVEGGGQLKARTKQSQLNGTEKAFGSSDSLPCPLTIMAIEVYIQCRTGRAGVNDSRSIAMTPDSDRDAVFAVVYVLSRDPGGGEPLQFLERGCLFVPVGKEIEQIIEESSSRFEHFVDGMRKSLPPSTFGVSSPVSIECVRDEHQLLLRLASVVRWKDPDMLLSWDTQGAGLGYLIERGVAIGKDGAEGGDVSRELDMARLLGRTPTVSAKLESSRLGRPFESDDAASAALAEMDRSVSNGANDKSTPSYRWKGSGLSTEWDDRVGAGAAAASIVRTASIQCLPSCVISSPSPFLRGLQSGRLVFSAWKIIADEVKHPNCSYLPAVVASILNKRIPFHDHLKLAQWYGHDRGRERWRVLHHQLTRAVACLQLFDALDIVGRSGEAARLSGVELSQSFPGIRGSQYKVEGVLLRALQSLNSDERGSKKGRRRRLSHNLTGNESLTTDSKSQTQSPWKARRHAVAKGPENELDSQLLHQLSDRCYYFFSPSLQDTTRQEALEAQALTLEPHSGVTHAPVVVCDFTALYPSLVIAYNLCYSTCAGKLDYHTTRNDMRVEGRTTGKVGPMQYAEGITATVLKHHVKSLSDDTLGDKDRAYAAPTGAIFVSETVVKGVLPQVLDEMLSTRAMLKKAAKQYKKHVPDLSPSILRQLEARQLALKYVANVTYGYTSATFSGRCAMPLLADTIVECGRRTLTNAINLAVQWGRNPAGRWKGIEVIYGDTDSIFIKIPGRSTAEAFQFGEEFCKAVTDSNPPPVQLKLEKVYLGSMMQTKKKYCGMKFESKNQRRPTFEAKGLETIRRDQCSLTQKILRNSLVTLFHSGIDAVKSYLLRQWALILSGKLPVSDFILTGRVRSRYRGGRIGPVQAVLSRRLAEADPAKLVRHGERQAYVIVATPGAAFKLRDCVVTPMELLEQWDAYAIHTAYYITKHVNAALQRCLGLAPYRVDVSAWFEASPKPRRRIHFWPSTRSRQNTMMISTFFGSDKCSLCGRKCMASSRSRAAVCQDCRDDPVKAIESAMKRLNMAQKDAHSSARKCSKCNLCFEDASTFATVRSIRSTPQTGVANRSVHATVLVTPLANCSCIDCPVTFERHHLRENEMEAIAICEALDAI